MRKPLLHHLHDYFLPHARNEFQPHLFRRTSIIALSLFVIACEVGYLAETKYVFPNTDFLASVLPGVLTDLTNADRATSNLSPLTRDAKLDAAAQAAAEDMAQKGYFSHVAPDGTTPWHWLQSAGYAYSYAGQNLAVNFNDSKDVETAWLASPTHRENIMKEQYTEIGFGTATGMYEGQEATFVVEYFGTPALAVAPASPKVALAKKPAQSTASSNVLGVETKPFAPVVATSAPSAPARTETIPRLPSGTRSFLAMLTSPLSLLEAILTALLALVATAYGVALLVHGKTPHPRLALGGALLLVIISSALLVGGFVNSPVMIASGSQMASVVAALP